MRIIVVFDTNVVLSALGWGGKPGKCLELAREGQVLALTCEPILNEVAHNLSQKLGFTTDETVWSIQDLKSFMKVVPIKGQLQAVPGDPKDNPIIECAVLGGATHIVSGDRRHLLSMRAYGSIPIVTPADFLQLLPTDSMDFTSEL